MAKLILLNKPYDMLPQFTDDQGRATLADVVDVKDVYPAGRLDRDSEGLMLLTDNGRLQAEISHPKYRKPKTYFAQVEGVPDEGALEQLRRGVELKDGMTRRAEAEMMKEPEWLWPRNPPIRVRKSVPDSWIRLTISEGKNRQVRRMTAAVGHPCLRLIRYQVGDWNIDGLMPGEWDELEVDAPVDRGGRDRGEERRQNAPSRPKRGQPPRNRNPRRRP